MVVYFVRADPSDPGLPVARSTQKQLFDNFDKYYLLPDYLQLVTFTNHVNQGLNIVFISP